MNADEAEAWAASLDRSRARAGMTPRFDALRDVGLGYLRIGQPMKTLSGGERQRLRSRRRWPAQRAGRTLYLCDEPTTGLHPTMSHRLLGVFDRLIDAGHTVLAVEHNLDVIARADWIIDLGPEGGPAGGRVVAAGTPEAVAACDANRTPAALRAYFSRRL